MKNVLAILTLVIAISEIFTMALMSLFEVELFWAWLPALFDASVVSLVAIIASNIMVKRSIIQLHGAGRQEWTQLKIGSIVFVSEAILMLVLQTLPFPLNYWQALVLDVTGLSLISSYLICRLVFKPYSKPEEYKTSSVNSTPIITANILGYISFMVLLLMILFSSYKQQLQVHQTDIESREANELYLAKTTLSEQLHHASLDLLVLAKQRHMQGLVNGDNFMAIKLADDFKRLIEIKGYFSQIRFLDLHGKEVIRVQTKDGKTSIIPPSQLQDKSQRYYFQESIKLREGEIHISPLDLNIEHGQIEIPFQPVLRLSTPIPDINGKISGVLVINLSGKQILQTLQKADDSCIGKLMMLNEAGYWLYGEPDKSAWDFMFKKDSHISMQNYDPEIWKRIELTPGGTIRNDKGSYVFDEFEFASDTILSRHITNHSHQEHIHHWPKWKLVSFIPEHIIKEQIKPVRYLMSMLYIAVVILAAIGTFIVTRAMQKHQQAEVQITQLAFYDSLTGLTNRQLFYEKLRLEVKHARRQNHILALMYLDLDHFKPVNDELGHEAGDAILQETAQRLGICLRDTDTIARIGGDEFVVILPRATSKDEIANIAQRIIDSFNVPFHINNQKRHIGISIGISLLSDEDENIDELIHRADQAMYKVKQSSRNDYAFAD
ncbi:MAG: diguanylate cyclase [Gammaproteobacteria bacterium]|nr:diguanylate cyclase [Gammaproteobacteria bacterium]